MSDTSQSIEKISIESKMNSAYLEYAMSVIIGRALPDVRDGLKPVHRRILYSMHNLNLAYNRPYMKSARIVGEVIGKYHPHGDVAIYDATVRMAQHFSMRYQLVDGQGNFGSVDGDSPAAMRYTEIRLKKISSLILENIDKNTVDFVENYDSSLSEPSVLPTKLPTLLINGSTGIAVGMATNIPPHNLTEIINSLLYLIDSKEDASMEGLMEHIKGPDFPTGGIIMGTKGIHDAYTTGRGLIRIRSRTNVEAIRGSVNREALIVTELPYGVNKARLIEKIADLVKDKKIEGISDIRDESDRSGMRIVIELKKNEIPEVIEANLLKQTSLQTTFGVILLAVVNGQPKELNLMECLMEFISFRFDVTVRRIKYELNKAEEREHILEGLKIAVDDIDSVIELIKAANNSQEAKSQLHAEYGLSDIQAQAVLEMRLQRLTGLERDKLLNELNEIKQKIEYYRDVLSDDDKVYELIRGEFVEIKEEHGDERKTEISFSTGDIDNEQMIPEESMVVTITKEGYVKRCLTSVYQTQRRGGKGKIGLVTKQEDIIDQMFTSSTHSTLLMFSNLGKVYWKKVYELPLTGRTGKGRPIVNILPLEEGERILSSLPIDGYDNSYIVMLTKNGIIKKSEIKVFQNQRTNGVKAIVFDDGDELISARICHDNDHIFIATKWGLALQFPLSQARAQGRVTRGSMGIRLKTIKDIKDEVISMEIINSDSSILTITELGYGKKSSLTEYRLGNRRNAGYLNIRITPKNGSVIGAFQVNEDDEILVITSFGKIIRVKTTDINDTGRITQGVKVIHLEPDERVAAAALAVEIEDDEKPSPDLLSQLAVEDSKSSDESDEVSDDPEDTQNTESK